MMEEDVKWSSREMASLGSRAGGCGIPGVGIGDTVVCRECSGCSSGVGGGVFRPPTPEERWRLRPVGPIKHLWHSLHLVRSSGGGIVGAGQHTVATEVVDS